VTSPPRPLLCNDVATSNSIQLQKGIVMNAPTYGPGVEISGRITPEYAEILSPEAVAFAVGLQRTFGARRTELLALRATRQKAFDAGKLPDFLPETRSIREGNWTCASVLPDIQDRRVEITGPVDRKMIINALNSGASVFMADFEDANTPKWDNNIQGHLNLRDAIGARSTTSAPRKGLQARCKDRHAVRAAARLAFARKARQGRRRADFRRHLRLRPVFLPQREGVNGTRQRPLFLLAQARKPSRGAAVE
jgi:malate synthase